MESNNREKESTRACFKLPLASDVWLLETFRGRQIKFYIRASPCSLFIFLPSQFYLKHWLTYAMARMNQLKKKKKEKGIVIRSPQGTKAWVFHF